MNEQKSGGIHISNVGRDVKIEAGGHIVAHDMVTTTNAGFDDQQQKQEFLQQMDELRAALREIKSQVESVESFDEDAKDQLVMEILQQVSELKQAQQEADQLEPGQPPPADKLKSVGQCLEKAGGLLDKIKGIGDTAAGIAERVVPIVARALPILASARHLLGIP
jgi:DNA repair exonuclease SbcCD ATPase subunit